MNQQNLTILSLTLCSIDKTCLDLNQEQEVVKNPGKLITLFMKNPACARAHVSCLIVSNYQRDDLRRFQFFLRNRGCTYFTPLTTLAHMSFTIVS